VVDDKKRSTRRRPRISGKVDPQPLPGDGVVLQRIRGVLVGVMPPIPLRNAPADALATPEIRATAVRRFRAEHPDLGQRALSELYNSLQLWPPLKRDAWPAQKPKRKRG
jgi:hypothetical protein